MIEDDWTVRCHWQRSKGHVLQSTVCHDNQAFISKLRSCGRKYHAAQFSSCFLKRRIRIGYSCSALCRCFERLNNTASRQRFRYLSRNVLDLFSLRQLKCLQRIGCHSPEIASRLTERV